jgi:AraC family transcriptional regulator, arabinose operon regulatory protein
MDNVLDTPWMKLKRQRIDKLHSEQLCWDNPFARVVAAPLFQAGIKIAAIFQSPNYSGASKNNPDHSFRLLLQGAMHVEQGGLSVDMQPGDLSYIMPGQPYSRTTRHTPSRMIYFLISDRPEWSRLKQRGPYVRRYESTQLMFLLLRGAIDAMRTTDEDTVARALDNSRAIVRLLQNELKLPSNTTRHNSNFEALTQSIIDAPERNWTDVNMSKSLRISERQLTRVFKDAHGVSPLQFVIRQRLLKALVLLDHSEAPIDSIASSLGYQSLHSFTRLFSTHIGVSPGQYRKEKKFRSAT